MSKWNETRRGVLVRDRGRCRYCGADLLSTLSAWWSATVDHVIAVSAGGGDEMSNLVLACPSCNSMLSRSASRKTFEKRLAFVAKRRREERRWFKELRRELR